MKKVLFTATVDSHILHFHLPYLKMFKEKGYEVHVATNTDDTIPFCDVKHVVSFERNPFKFNNIKAFYQLKKICNKEKFEIIHTHTPMGSVITRLAAKKARKKWRTRVIYTAHGFHFFKGANKINWMLYYPVEKFLAKYTDTLITINEEDYDLAKRKFYKRCYDIQFVPGVGIDEAKFDFPFSDNDKLEFRHLLGLKKDDFVLIYPAELSSRKRQEWLIKALSSLLKKNKKIHVLLPGKDSLNGKLQKFVNELELDNQIHFLGYRNDIPKLLKISNVAISSANQEGLPVNIMEAMYTGLPIVASNCRGNRDLVIDNVNGYLVDLDDNCKFSKSIEKLYSGRYKEFENKSKTLIKKYLLDIILIEMDKIYFNNISLIIPNCTDLNRGDQALVLETKNVIDLLYPNNDCYMMSSGETIQCEKFGLKKFGNILKHPSRFEKKESKVNYSTATKLKWGVVAVFDFINSSLLLNKGTRSIIKPFLSYDVKRSLYLYEKSKSIFVKGGGFLHDYSGGIIGLYTMYYQTFHIKLAIKMKKDVYIMPNSYGPFNSVNSRKMVLDLLKSCKFVSARESISSNGITNTLGKDIALYPDLAFFLKKSENNEIIKEIFEKYKIDKDNDDLVAITVRPYRFYSYENPEKKYQEYKETFIRFIKYLVSINYKVLLVVHTRAENNHENDEMCIDEIIEKLGKYKNVYKIKDDRLNCYNLKELYGYCKYVIGTRFHSVIFSLEQKIPCIAITYGGNKGDGIMKDLDLEEYAIKIGELNYDKLKETFNNMLRDEKKIKEKINRYLLISKKKYKEMIEMLKEE